MTTEAKTMTREELDEAIAELHEMKPVDVPAMAEDGMPSKSGWWIFTARRKIKTWLPLRPTVFLPDSKRLTDGLDLDGWEMNLYSSKDDVLKWQCRLFGPNDRRALGRATTEELARSLAYYEAKTGIRIEIKENDAEAN